MANRQVERRIEKQAISAKCTIFSVRVRRVVYNGTELVKLRERTGLSQAEFASLCGWSQQHQSRLELPYDQAIDYDKLNLINQKAEEILARQK